MRFDFHSAALLLSLVTIPLASAAPYPNNTEPSHHHPGNVASILHHLHTDAQGSVQLSSQGVLHSYDGNGKVVDFLQLDPSQVEEFTATQKQVRDASEGQVPEEQSTPRSVMSRQDSACLSAPCRFNIQCADMGCFSCVKYIEGTHGYCMNGIIT